VTPQAVLADPGFTALKQRLLETTGLAYYSDRDKDLAERIARRSAHRNAQTCAAYLALLDGGDAGERELDAIIAELTIGETYFFREGAQFRVVDARKTIDEHDKWLRLYKKLVVDRSQH
jgi:chemotaxis protein methyltransferase CheR